MWGKIRGEWLKTSSVGSTFFHQIIKVCLFFPLMEHKSSFKLQNDKTTIMNPCRVTLTTFSLQSCNVFSLRTEWVIMCDCRGRLLRRLQRQVLQLPLIAQINQSKAAAGGGTHDTFVWVKVEQKGAIKDRLPPKVCCRSCRWRRESWCLGRHRNASQSRGSWSPLLGSCCRRVGGSGRSRAWRT